MEAPPKAELESLRTNGKNRDEIAAHYGVSLSRVKRWIAEHEIKPSLAPRKSHVMARNKAEKRRACGEEDGLTLIEKARVILGKRMSEDYRGYLLDGRPVRIDTLARVAGLTIPDVP
jgi:hypothetical protein